MRSIAYDPALAGAPEAPRLPLLHAARRARRARLALGALLVVQGLAHAAAGTWASTVAPAWFVAPTWAAAMVGFIGAGLGLWGVLVLRRWWRQLALAGAIGSLLLLMFGSVGAPFFLLGLVLDLALVLTALEWEPPVAPVPRAPVRPRQRVALALATLALAWVALAVLARPWHVQWGTTAAERLMPLPGDAFVHDARYRTDHAITIDAPVDVVQGLVAPLEQGRRGVGSYGRLERQVVVRPQDDGRTRLHVRLRGQGRPSWLGVLLGPVHLLGVEPAHFLRERGVLRGIAARAERASHL